jgi:hypothetical protein
MAKREKEKYLEKKTKILPSKRETGRPEAGREAPTEENGETLWEKTRVTVAATKSKEVCNLETNTAWETSLTEGNWDPF